MVRSGGWFIVAGLAALVAIPFGLWAFHIAFLSGECADWVPLGCGQIQTALMFAAGFGAVAAWRRGVDARESSKHEPLSADPIPEQESGTIADAYAPGKVWRSGDDAHMFFEGDGDLMWLAKVIPDGQGRWSLHIDRTLTEGDADTAYHGFGVWRSEKRAFAAVDEIIDVSSWGAIEFRFADDFGGVIEANAEESFAADWAVAAPLLPDHDE